MNLPPTVFLVDDEALVRKAVGRLLRAEGFEVAAFASPGEFLAAQDPAAPGCLVLDMAMPGLDGLELQRALAARGSALPIIFLTGRANVPMCAQAMKRGAAPGLSGFDVMAELERRFPVVVITARDSSEAEARTLGGGAAAYLRKPVNDRELIEAISTAIAHSTTGDFRPSMKRRAN